MRRSTFALFTAAAGGTLLGLGAAGMVMPDGNTDLFDSPVRLKSGDEYINVAIGHAAPYLYDFDGDGVLDLIVGQFGQGRMRIYRNLGTNENPRYDGYEYFMAGGAYGTVPAG